MSAIKFDIDLIFKSLTGWIMALVNEEGIILKVNSLAVSLVGKKNKSSIEGKHWDKVYSALNPESIGFKQLIEISNQYHTIELNANGSKELFELKVDRVENTETNSNDYYLVTGRKLIAGTWEDMLYKIMEGSKKDVGKDFLISVTENIAETLKVDFVCISKVTNSSKKAKAIAFWDKDHHRPPFEYDITTTPCKNVYGTSQQKILCNLLSHYPDQSLFNEAGIESYLGTPIYYTNGKPFGVLSVMDTKPMSDNSALSYILSIFASRIGSEIEWYETQKSLRAKDVKLRSVIDAIPHPIFFKDKSGRYEGINQAFIEETQLSEEEIIGQSSIKTKPTSDKAENDQSLLSTPGKIMYETERLKKSGELKQYLMTKSTIVNESNEIDGIAGAALDITNLKKAETELKANEEKYRMLFSTANDAIFILNKDIFIDCNEKTLDMFECERNEIVGHPPYEFSPRTQPDGKLSMDKALAKIEKALKGKPQQFYWVHTKKTGTPFDAEVSLNALYVGNDLYIQAIVRDVSDKMQLAQNTEIQNKRMEEMYKFISTPEISLKEQVSNLLELATKSLGFEIGLINKIETDTYYLLDKYGLDIGFKINEPHSLADTYCTLTAKKDRLVAINEVGKSDHRNIPAYKKFKMESFIGAPYWVRGKRYGTLVFLSRKPTHNYRTIDLDFIQMLAQWVGSAIERDQFEQNLLERDALLETMLREIPVDFSVRDSNLNLVIQSDISKQIWGNIEGKPIDYSDIDVKSQKNWKDIYKRALKGEVIKGEAQLEIHGKPFTFYNIVSPVKIKDKITEVITINLDISKIKETEEKLKEQNIQLTKLNSELDRFVYSASHDLRAPLASLLGLIDLATRERN
ncbi:MAG: PAS domain S-box protein, partial [Bacteroidota bacterium]